MNRNPFILFLIVPTFLFLVYQRFSTAKASKREKHSVYWMNLALLGMATVMSMIFGFKNYVIIQLIVMGLAASAGSDLGASGGRMLVARASRAVP